jgi:predicted RecB family nuclease
MTDTTFESVFSDPAIRRGTGRPEAYKTADGKRVPSVTTILSRFKDSGGLLYWANNQGLDGKTLAEARKAPLDTGSLVHRMIEAEIHGDERPEVPEEYAAGVESAYGAWREWMESYDMKIEATEWPLVSETYRFAGTIDLVMRDRQGRLAIGDIKAANSIYVDHLLQLAAYGELWNGSDEEQVTGGYHLLRFSKENGDFAHHHFPSLDDAHRLFLVLREAYDLDKIVKKRAK